MTKEIEKIAYKALRNEVITTADALYLMQREGNEVYDLFYWANQIRLKYHGQSVKVCSIISVKQGKCTEDCRFCSQSSHYYTGIEEFPLAGKNTVLAAAQRVELAGSCSLGIVTSGYGLSDTSEFNRLSEIIRVVSEKTSVQPHGSFGVLTREKVEHLLKCGLKRINHNLETSERFFPHICTTHTFKDRVNMIRLAKEVGLEVCCGAIFGLGEEPEDRVDLAFTLKKLDVDVVPLNFLHPIPGTPMEDKIPLMPVEALKIISVFRFILPDKQIKVAGGREIVLRDLQSWMFYAGANSTMIGNYLTTKGRKVEDDLQMIKDLNLKLETD